MLRAFRAIALIEGTTTLLLFLVAMPLKYLADFPALVPPVGWAHGVAFIAYMVALIPGLWGKGFTVFQWFRTFIAAFFPFGTFLNDPMLKRRQQARSGSLSTAAA